MNVPDTIYGKLAPETAGAGVGDPVCDPQTEEVAWCGACCGQLVPNCPGRGERASKLVDRDDPATQSAMPTF